MNLDDVRIEVLGTPRVTCKGETLVLTRRRVRALLYLLAVENQPMARSRLCWLLWPDKEQPQANRVLSVHLSYLRKELGDSIVHATLDTVMLNPLASTDVRDFITFTRRGGDVATLQAADLFRGQLLAGFSIKDSEPFDQWLASTSHQWSMRFAETCLQASYVLERQQRHTEALERLSAAIAAEPLQENLYRQAMRVMDRSGRRGQVGKLFQDLSSLLNDELGVPPSMETVACYQEIIGTNETFTTTVNTQVHSIMGAEEEMPFVGRYDEFEELAAEAAHRFVLVDGPSGIGRTRFVKEYCSRTMMRTLWVSFRQHEQSAPYLAIVNGVKSLTGSPEWPALAEHIQQVMRPDRWTALCYLVPEVGALARTDEGVFSITTQQVTGIFEQLLSALSTDAPLLVALDDLHFADSASIGALRMLIGAPTLSNVCFVSTISTALMGPDASRFLNDLQRESLLKTIHLSALSTDEMMELLLFYFPDMAEETASKLMELAEGNPSWVRTIIRGLDSGYTEFSGKASLAALFDFTLQSLSTQALVTAERLVMLGAPCEDPLFAVLCGTAQPEAVLAELTSAGLTGRNALGTVEFVNAKISEHLLARINTSPQRARQLHLALAQSLCEVYGQELSDASVLAIATHYRASNHPELCGLYALRAGDYLMQFDDIQSSIEYFKLAARYLEAPLRFDAALLLYVQLTHAGQYFEADLYLRSSIELAKETDRMDYALAFEAAAKLSAMPEYREVQAGLIPCYKTPESREIPALLHEAQRQARQHHASLLLRNYLLAFLSTYHMIVGSIEASKDCLNAIVSLNLWNNDEECRNANTLVYYSSLITLITILNQKPDPQLYSVIALEEDLFHERPIASFSATAAGVKALLANIRGHVDEGERLMDQAIEESLQIGNRIAYANNLATQAMLIHQRDPQRALELNMRAHRAALDANSKYALIRALIGLIVTCPSRSEAYGYLDELRGIAARIGDAALYDRIAKLNETIDAKQP